MARVEMNFRNIILIIAVVILLASASAYTVFAIVGAPLGGGRISVDSEQSRGRSGPGPVFNVGTMTINLAARSGATSGRVVRAGIAFELDGEKTKRQLEQREEQVKDRIISIMRQQTPEDIATNEGLDALKVHLKEAIDGVLSEGHVVDVYFFDLVVP